MTSKCNIKLNTPDDNNTQRAKHWENLMIWGYCKDCGLGMKQWKECPECGTKYEKNCETRVWAGMKCGMCAYGNGGNGGYVSCEDMAKAEIRTEAEEENESNEDFLDGNGNIIETAEQLREKEDKQFPHK